MGQNQKQTHVKKEANQETREMGFEIEEFIITPQSICQFELMPNRRQISESHVQKIHAVLIKGKNPLGVLIVNRRNNKLRLIDGNHRIESVKKFYAYRDSFKSIHIKCILKVYDNLTDAQEIQVYTDEATRRNESYEDRLKLYANKIQIWKSIQDDFPCKVSIYPSETSIRLRILINAIYSEKQNTRGIYNYNFLIKEDLIPYAMENHYEDYLQLKEFINFFQSIFGLVEKRNIWIREHIFVALYDVYVKNKQYSQMDTFRKRFSNIINRADIIPFTRMTGREASNTIRKLMIDHMNFNIKSDANLFV